MSIQESKKSKYKDEINYLENKLTKFASNLSNENDDEIVESVKEKVNNFIFDLKNLVLKDEEIIELNGNVYSSDELLKFLRDVTGSNSWKLDSKENVDNFSDDVNFEYFRNAYSINFKDSLVKKYYFSCQAIGKHLINQIIFTVFPYYFHVGINTRSAYCELDGLVTYDEMKKEIAKRFNN